MDSDLMAYLKNICAKNGIRVIFENRLSAFTPSSTSLKARCIVLNMNFHNRKELPLQFAHEIAHILNGSSYDLAFYHASFSSHSKIEKVANVGAVKLLLDYANSNDIPVTNMVNFMASFGIPTALIETVNETLGLYLSAKHNP